MGQRQKFIDARREVIAELQAEIARREAELPRKSAPLQEFHKKEIAELKANVLGLERKIYEVERSWEYEVEKRDEKEAAARAEERTILQRSLERQQRKHAEQEAYNRRVNSEIDWRSVNVHLQRERTAIVQAHLAELDRRKAKNAKIDEALGANDILEDTAKKHGVKAEYIRGLFARDREDLAFETSVNSPLTGYGYTVITEKDGATWVDRDLTSSAPIGRNGESGE